MSIFPSQRRDNKSASDQIYPLLIKPKKVEDCILQNCEEKEKGKKKKRKKKGKKTDKHTHTQKLESVINIIQSNPILYLLLLCYC